MKLDDVGERGGWLETFIDLNQSQNTPASYLPYLTKASSSWKVDALDNI
jgi:hypothetical protein